MLEIRRGKYAGIFDIGSDIKTIEGGDWVLVRARVMPDGQMRDGRRVRILTISGYQQTTVVNDDIICYTDPPIPTEPHYTSLLVSKKGEKVTMWTKERSGKYWRLVGSDSDDYVLLWSELYTAHGPFEEYTSTRTIQ